MAGRTHRPPLALALAVFFASGFAALLYQVIWQRMLALFSGGDVFSVTIIVAAFMAGLGCGNLAGGHLADRVSRSRCLAFFAAAETAIGLFALASRWIFYDVLYGRFGAVDLPGPALAAVLFAAVLWPTFFMGISLPLLARGLSTGLASAARTVASLYGFNTLGAAIGALLTTWFLLRHFPMEQCLWIGAALNFGCAAAALPLARSVRASGADSTPAIPADASAESHSAGGPVLGLSAWLLVYALSGAIALSLEIAWFRALGVMLKSTSFTFGTLLAVYLSGVASGSIVGARLVLRGVRDPAARFLWIQTGVAVYAGLSLALLVAALGRVDFLSDLWTYFQQQEGLPLSEALRQLAGGAPAVAGEHHARLFLALYGLLPLLLIGPPTFLMGLSFPYLQKAVQTDGVFLGRRVGWLQSANIAGSLFGSILTGFVLLPALGTAGTFRLLVSLAAIFPLLCVFGRTATERPSRLALAAGLGAVIFASALIPNGQRFWAALHGAAPDEIHFVEDAAGVSLLRNSTTNPSEQWVMAGGLALSAFPFGGYEGIHTLLGLLPVLIHPNPRRVAVIGVGSGDTAYGAAGRGEVENVVAIEILGSQVSLLHDFDARGGDPGLHALLADARIEIVVDDGRAFLRRDRGHFDVIEADALRPTSAYAGNLYSLEYFALLRERLAPGGLAVTWIPTERVLTTFVKSFPYVLVVDAIAIGSESPIPFDRAELERRVRDPRVRDHFTRAGVDVVALVDRLLESPPVRIGPAANRKRLTDVNRDLFARDEFMVDPPARADGWAAGRW